MEKKKKGKEKADRVKRILNCIPSKETERDWEFEDALEAGILEPDAEVSIPKEWDLREDWWQIGNQRSTGSCVGWAAADSLIRWHFVKAGRLEPGELLSIRYIWMASKETDIFTRRPTTFIERSGTSLKATLDIARKYGVVTDSVLPFQPSKLYTQKAATFYSLASTMKISSYYNLRCNQGKWRRWLATEGPLLTRLNVDKTWRRASSTNGNLDDYLEDTAEGGHAVAIVGYTEDRFIIRNSWGTNWGESGFGYASLKYAEDAFCSLFTEVYGVKL